MKLIGCLCYLLLSCDWLWYHIRFEDELDLLYLNSQMQLLSQMVRISHLEARKSFGMKVMSEILWWGLQSITKRAKEPLDTVVVKLYKLDEMTVQNEIFIRYNSSSYLQSLICHIINRTFHSHFNSSCLLCLIIPGLLTPSLHSLSISYQHSYSSSLHHSSFHSWLAVFFIISHLQPPSMRKPSTMEVLPFQTSRVYQE